MSVVRAEAAPLALAQSPLEMWGGVECTVNRVGNRYFNQLERTGHARRIRDLDRFAALGIRAGRYPVLWERTAPRGIEALAARRVAGGAAWSLLGAFDWHTLVTRDEGHYEPGVFDVRGREVRPTALAAMVRALASGHDYYHPALAGQGWWRRPERLLYPPAIYRARRKRKGRNWKARSRSARDRMCTGATASTVAASRRSGRSM